MWIFVPEWQKGIFNIEGTQIAPKCTFFRPKLSLMNTQVPACHPVTKYLPGNIVFPNIKSVFVKCPGMTKFKISFGVTIFHLFTLVGVSNLFIIKIRIVSNVIKLIDHFLVLCLPSPCPQLDCLGIFGIIQFLRFCASFGNHCQNLILTDKAYDGHNISVPKWKCKKYW